jgi:hypothetical protein
MPANIEFIMGQETHSSNWGKFYVKGLEAWQCNEGSTRDKHQSYTDYQCNDVPDGTIFTIFEQSGNKRGTDTFAFTICQATGEQINMEDSAYGSGKIAGNYKILARAITPTKAPRLMGWWIDLLKDQDPAQWAQHCAAHIDKRGVKNPPPMEAQWPDKTA